jgi:hypothetical protein
VAFFAIIALDLGHPISDIEIPGVFTYFDEAIYVKVLVNQAAVLLVG